MKAIRYVEGKSHILELIYVISWEKPLHFNMLLRLFDYKGILFITINEMQSTICYHIKSYTN